MDDGPGVFLIGKIRLELGQGGVIWRELLEKKIDEDMDCECGDKRQPTNPDNEGMIFPIDGYGFSDQGQLSSLSA